MPQKNRNITEVYNIQVFTDAGDYFGDVEEAVLQLPNKVAGWRIKSTKNSYLSRVLGGARGVVVPHQLVKAIGDVMIISRNAVPNYEESLEE
ncbi:PRC-barrel domain-containing protein [Candidatus Woesearchaeota archaeon]|nr:PRC-barrel domain-containing protein [Candidatus Woesearchaeota archaeon]